MSSVNTHYQNQVADLLGQIRAHQGEPSNRADLIRSDTPGVGGIGHVNEPGKGNFATYMADAFNGVNDTQQASAELKNAYERPSPMSYFPCKRHPSVLKRRCRYETNSFVHTKTL
jgi:flagellar hook-basal body complex protein FliE